MKIAVIGGAGVRTPLLVNGLTDSDLPIEEVALYDTDQERLAIIGSVAARMRGGARVTLAASVAECVRGAGFVFTSIRVGGIAQRVRDEVTAQRHGIVGQETIGRPASRWRHGRSRTWSPTRARSPARHQTPGSSTSRTRSA